MTVDLTVVIVSFQVRDLLSRCVESLARAQGKTNVQFVVVYNASADRSSDMLRARFPDVCLLANSENVGFARANNQGLKIAQGRYQMLLNPDTEIPLGE